MSKKEKLRGLGSLPFICDLVVKSAGDDFINYYYGKIGEEKFSLSCGDDFVHLFIGKKADNRLLDFIKEKVGQLDVKSSFKGGLFRKQFYYAWVKDKTEAEKLYQSLRLSACMKGFISSMFGFGYSNPELLAI